MAGNAQVDLAKEMTEGKIQTLLWRLCPPAIAGVLVATAWNLVDSYFARDLGNAAVAAIGVVFSVLALIQAVGYLIGMGAGSLLSRILGQDDTSDSGLLIVASGILTALFGVLFWLLMRAFPERILRVMGAGEQAMPYALLYMRYVAVAAGPMLAAFVLGNLLRAMGRPGFAAMGTVAGVLVDVAVNEWLRGRGMQGIGVAALSGQLASAALLIVLFYRERGRLSWGALHCKSQWERIGKLTAACLTALRLGTPSLFRQGTGSVAVIMLNRVAGSISIQMQSAMSITAKVTLLLFSFAIGCSQALQPILGYNLGAGEKERRKKAFFACVRYGTVGMSVLAAVSYVLAPWLLGWFSAQDEVIELAVLAFRYQCFALPTVMLANGANILFQACGRPGPACLIAAFRQGIFFLPLLWLLPRLFAEVGIYLAQPLADIAAFFACIPFIWHAFYEDKSF